MAKSDKRSLEIYDLKKTIEDLSKDNIDISIHNGGIQFMVKTGGFLPLPQLHYEKLTTVQSHKLACDVATKASEIILNAIYEASVARFDELKKKVGKAAKV